MTTSSVALMRLRENDVVDDFRRAGAVSPTSAKSLAEIGTGESLAFARLCERAVIQQPTPGCFYLDEEVWEAIRRQRRRLGLILVTTLVLVTLAIAFGIFTTR